MPTGVIGEGDVVFVVTVENATAAGLMGARSDINKAATQIQGEVNSKFANVGNMVKSTEESFRRLGNTLVGAGGAITGTFTLPLVLGFKSLLDAGVDFETEIQRVVSLFYDGVKPMNELKKEFIDFSQAMALTSQYSATEVTKAMYMMGQAGYTVTDIYEAIPNILNLATAQQYEVAGTFDVVNTVLKAYQLSAADSYKVTNMLAAAATEFNLTMADYDKGLKYVLGTSKSLNLDLSEMLVMFGALTDRGYTGMQAGRILRDAIADLIAPVGKSTDIIKKYNLEIYSNQEEINGVANAYTAAKYKLDMMQRGTAGTTKELADLNAQIAQNNVLIGRAQMGGLTEDVQYLTIANQYLKDTYSILNSQQRVNNADIAVQKQYVEQLGEAVDNTTIKGLVPFREVIKQVAESGMTAGEVYDLFGKQSGGAIIALSDLYRTNTAYFDEMIKKIEESNAADAQAAIQKQSTAFQVKQLREALDQLRVEGYMALAPVIKVINDFIITNMDSIKLLIREFIEGFIPALEKVFGVIQIAINWFSNMDTGHRKMLFGIIAGGMVFMAAVGPILLYIGSISWAIASFLKLGRGIVDTGILLAGNITKWLTLIITQNAATASLVNYNRAVAIGGAEIAMLNPSLVTTGSAFGIVEGGAFGAAGALSTVGTTIMAVLPYLAIFAIAAYAFYWAWKNNWLGLRDFTDQIMKDIKTAISESNIDVALSDLKADYENGISALMLAIEGLIEADGDKIEEATGLWWGSYIRKWFDYAVIMYDVGKMLWDTFIAGLMNQPIPEDPTRSMTEKWANKMQEHGDEVSDFWRGFVKGISASDYFIDEAGKLQKSEKLLTKEQDQILKDNATFQRNLIEQNMTQWNMTGGKMSYNVNYDPFAYFRSNASATNSTINATNKSLNKVNNTTTNIGENLLAGDKLLKAFAKDTDAVNAAMARGDMEAVTDIIKERLESDDLLAAAADAGEESGKYFGDALAESSIPYINSIFDMMSGKMPEIPGVATPAETQKTMTAKEAFGKYWQVGGAYYTPEAVRGAAAGAKSFDEYPSLEELMKGIAPAGMAGIAGAMPAATPAAAAAAATTNIADAMAPGAVGGGVTNIQNQFNINTYVYPAQAMDAAEINSLGDKITGIVESKLGEKYRTNEAV